MLAKTHFVIFKRDSCYSVTECSSSGVSQAFISDGSVSGNEKVLLRLSKMKPEGMTIESFIEKNAGSLIFA